MTTVHRAYRYRFYPTPEQTEQLARTFGCVRYIYNHFLRERTDAWFERQERMGYNTTAKALTTLKKQSETAFLAEVSNVCLQQSLRHLERAFSNFFKGQACYPTFKKKQRKQSATYMANGFRWRDGQLWLAKHQDPLNIRWSRSFSGQPTSITVSCDTAGRYHVSFLVEEDIVALPVTPTMVGIDLGLTHRVITSHGDKIPNPRFLRRTKRKLTLAQRNLSRKQKGSNNRAKARLQVAKIHATLADQRQDATHKLSTQLIHENQVIAAESLQVKNLLKNRSLAKAISDVSWGELVRQLDYKAQRCGRDFVQIDKWYPSSKRCFHCGHITDKMPLNVRTWDCSACGTQGIDRDINAARNILQAGKAILVGADKLRQHEKKTTVGLTER
ncbi:IS200/IS605 family element transposase accessory protein TnpB [Halomonas sp. ZH2S]|uniref:IS200/IS605 family element transposase accessory protein TnpB n=1 Tax=Vreelandella zhuhanensis TaxID=2684210 RepID=A0A7X3H2C3_9GAMM|nr:RNA-guided endonuclease TnpB family protein [Halomonas zhuhanensis]MWJ29059.1 IS200/IS605 family element transposase accessory protein TnpB [Halomonas zhuhanensis]